jgi:hypothetical protein
MASGYSDMIDSRSSQPERDDETLELREKKQGAEFFRALGQEETNSKTLLNSRSA